MNKGFVYYKDKALVIDEMGEITKEVNYHNDLSTILKIENQIDDLENGLIKDIKTLKENDSVKYITPKEYIIYIQLITILGTTLAMFMFSNESFFDMFKSTINTRFKPMNTYLFFNILSELSCSLPLTFATCIISKLNIKNQKNKHDELTKDINDKKELLNELYNSINEIENNKKNTNILYKDFDIINIENNTLDKPKVRSLKRR